MLDESYQRPIEYQDVVDASYQEQMSLNQGALYANYKTKMLLTS